MQQRKLRKAYLDHSISSRAVSASVVRLLSFEFLFDFELEVRSASGQSHGVKESKRV